MNYGRTGEIRELKQRINKKTGIYEVVLSKNNKRHFYTVAKLVAEAFIPNPMQKPEVMHKSIDKSDNSVENLEWAYRTELLHNMYNKGSRKNCIPSYTKLTYNGKLYNDYMQIAKDIFTFASDGLSEVKEEFVNDDNNDVILAAESCPTAAIKLTEVCNCEAGCDCGCTDGQECSCHK